jgi:hypothetical protein
MMAAQNERTSAKIYPFPARGRFAGPHAQAPAEKPFPTVAIGDAWYHDEAMKEEQKANARKH